jgi:deoxyribose-phosphate aldolase
MTTPSLTYKQIAKMIDHSLLRPELTEAEVIAGCELAKKYDVASVCVKPCHVRLAAGILAGTDVAVGTVIGFPHGSSLTAAKVFEANQAQTTSALWLKPPGAGRS